MNAISKATKLELFNLSSIATRTFWITSFAFFLCFFSWFGIVPFMPQVVKDLGLTPSQKWNSIILAVSGTIFARLLIGKLCDKYGPRLCYTWLLALGAIPVILLGLVQSPMQFMVLRFFVGFIGASFVITQFHTSIMYAPNIVGTANATAAGWGNLGGGANRLGMPLIAAGVVSFGVAEAIAWRYSMVIAGVMCLLMALVYFFYTQDTPEGNFKQLKESGRMPKAKKDEEGFIVALKDYRVWILFVIYGACFGMELTVYGTMDDYLQNTFQLKRVTAGNLVASFALMNIFARTLGGYFGDKFGSKKGLRGRVLFMAAILVVEGVMLASFASMDEFIFGFLFLIGFSLSVQMAEGATFAVVPFINKKAIGSISGIVGAGGNAGAFFAAMFLKSKSAEAEKQAIASAKSLGEAAMQAAQSEAAGSAVSNGYFLIGLFVIVIALISLTIKFSKEDEAAAVKAIEDLKLS